MDRNVSSIQKIVFFVVFLLMVPYILRWWFYYFFFHILYVVRRKKWLLYYCAINANMLGTWCVWHNLFQLCLKEIGFAVVVDLLATLHLPTRLDIFLRIYDMLWKPYCHSINRHQLASSRFELCILLTIRFNTKNHWRGLKMGLTLHPTYSSLVTSSWIFLASEVSTTLTWICIVVVVVSPWHSAPMSCILLF